MLGKLGEWVAVGERKVHGTEELLTRRPVPIESREQLRRPFRVARNRHTAILAGPKRIGAPRHHGESSTVCSLLVAAQAGLAFRGQKVPAWRWARCPKIDHRQPSPRREVTL
jgi:hypothetical protein